ncbi:MAG TPA: ferredoxin--nitrite reductase [Nitrospiraceae bacterium]|nr:ferredoxin--nitrite reductase [Nitrospiraceae bacterium]
MNKIEEIKRERDGLDVREAIARYAATGWESISEDDIQRLKWYGLFLRNPTPGYFMIRVRMPGGRTNAQQLRVLADIASAYGNGLLDLTTRQQMQLRQIRIEDVPAVFSKMESAGLTSLQTGMDNVRNIMTCPVAGSNPDELLDATPIIARLTQILTADRKYSNLPRKFNIAVTGCLDNCLHTETQDLALVPASVIRDDVKIAGFNVHAGGKLGSGGYRIAGPLNIFVTAPEAVEVCRAIIDIFRDYGPRDSRTTSRLAFLLDDWGEARFRDAVEHRLGWTLATAGVDARRAAVKDHIGLYRQKQGGLNYVGLKIRVGRIAAADLMEMAALAERYGTGEVRLSPAQTMILMNVPDRRVGDLTEESLVKRFTYNPSPIQKGLVSCVGNDYCNLAVIETKSRAVQVAKALESRLGSDLRPITMHWSGCPAGCGNHAVADIGLLGKKVKIKGQIVEAADVYVGGRSGPDPKPAVKLLEDVPCDKLASVLEGILPYHTREKMHRSRGTKASKKMETPLGRGRAQDERAQSVVPDERAASLPVVR